jgi:hypothetical protein
VLLRFKMEAAPLSPTPSAMAGTSSALAAGSTGGIMLNETQLGNMALRAKQQRQKAEQERQLLQVCDCAATPVSGGCKRGTEC